MKQQDAYKLLAAFMILIMIIVPVAYVITSPRSDSTQETKQQDSQTEKYDPNLWFINQPFYSISDALKITPVNTESASYADIDSMSPQMMQWAKSQLPVDEVDKLYNSTTKKLYYAKLPSLQNETPNFLLLSTMYPERNDFNYIVIQNTTNILRRMDTGAINLMGTPVIYAPNDQTASEVLEIIFSLNRTNSSFDQYEGLLNNVDDASYQIINSNVTFAKQFYMGLNLLPDGTYVRTTAYLNANPNMVKKFHILKTNSTQNGFSRYDINQSGNYTIVKVAAPDMFKVLTEYLS